VGQASKFRSHQVVHCNGKVTARAQTASSDGPHEGPALGAVLLAEGPVTALPALVDGHGAFAPLGRYGHRGRGRHVATAPSSLAAPVAAVRPAPRRRKSRPADRAGPCRYAIVTRRGLGPARCGLARCGRYAIVTPRGLGPARCGLARCGRYAIVTGRGLDGLARCGVDRYAIATRPGPDSWAVVTRHVASRPLRGGRYAIVTGRGFSCLARCGLGRYAIVTRRGLTCHGRPPVARRCAAPLWRCPVGAGRPRPGPGARACARKGP